MSKRLFVLFAALMATALVVAGCGSDDGDDTTTASLTKAQFVKEGNAICKEGNAKIDSGFEEFSKEKGLSKNEEPSEEVMEEGFETVLIPAIDEQIQGLRDLGIPEGDNGEVEELLSNAEAALEEAEEDPSSLTGEGQSAFTQVNKEAREYGLTVCGEE